MGVTGLLSYCLNNKPTCSETVDLVEIAERLGGIELIVDFDNFMNFLKGNFSKYLRNKFGNQHLMIIGAEFRTLDEYFLAFINDLFVAKIALVWVIDGAKGGSDDFIESKLSTWIDRHHRSVHNLREVMKVCANQRDMIPESDVPLPILLSTQMRCTLARVTSEMIQCVTGDADDSVAKTFLKRPKAYAILSDDSDFCIFEGCRVLPLQRFDIDDDLKWNDPYFLSERPILTKLKVDVIESVKLQRHFKFQSPSQLIDFSILKGNDFTRDLVTSDLTRRLGLLDRRPTVTDVVNWVREWGRIENCDEMAHELKNNRKLRDAIAYTRSFYRLEICEQPHLATTGYERFLADKIREGRFPPEVFSMYNQFYWLTFVCEDPSPGFPCVQIALRSLRHFLYSMLLPKGRDVVTEYGRGCYEELRTEAFQVNPRRNVIFVRHIKETEIHRNIRTFSYIMSHLEIPGSGYNFIQLYGRKNGFVFALLRYFLLLNWGRNLYLTQEEFLALVAVVTGREDETNYQGVCLCPSPRTVTIANWFLIMYRYTCVILGSLLYVRHEFPEPGEIFSGSVWTVFHMGVVQQVNFGDASARWVISGAKRRMHEVLYEKRNQIRKLVEGCFVLPEMRRR